MAYIAMRFVETPVFTRMLGRHLDDDAYRTLQQALVLRPEQGAVIQGSGGLRKLRWATSGQGKRGGLRLIYYWASREKAVYMLYLYAKSDTGDLSKLNLALSRERLRRSLDERQGICRVG